MLKEKFYVAGVQFHKLHTIIDDLQSGDFLDIIPEPTNSYDPNAVKIVAGGVMLGYVPKRLSADASALYDIHGTDLVCIIDSLNPEAKKWEQLEVHLELLSEEEEDDEDYDYDEEDEDEDYG